MVKWVLQLLLFIRIIISNILNIKKIFIQNKQEIFIESIINTTIIQNFILPLHGSIIRILPSQEKKHSIDKSEEKS